MRGLPQCFGGNIETESRKPKLHLDAELDQRRLDTATNLAVGEFLLIDSFAEVQAVIELLGSGSAATLRLVPAHCGAPDLLDAVGLGLHEELQHHAPEIGAVHERAVQVVDGDERRLSLELVEQILRLARVAQPKLARL